MEPRKFTFASICPVVYDLFHGYGFFVSYALQRNKRKKEIKGLLSTDSRSKTFPVSFVHVATVYDVNYNILYAQTRKINLVFRLMLFLQNRGLYRTLKLEMLLHSSLNENRLEIWDLELTNIYYLYKTLDSTWPKR